MHISNYDMAELRMGEKWAGQPLVHGATSFFLPGETTQTLLLCLSVPNAVDGSDINYHSGITEARISRDGLLTWLAVKIGANHVNVPLAPYGNQTRHFAECQLAKPNNVLVFALIADGVICCLRSIKTTETWWMKLASALCDHASRIPTDEFDRAVRLASIRWDDETIFLNADSELRDYGTKTVEDIRNEDGEIIAHRITTTLEEARILQNLYEKLGIAFEILKG